MRRSHLEPARVGVVLLSSQLRPVYYNVEAARILKYPDTPRDVPSLDAIFPIRPSLLASPSTLPSVIEFTSGRREYSCRTFLLDGAPRTQHRVQPRVVVLLERQSTDLRDIKRWSEQYQLTTRESETVRLLLKGFTSKEIADHMNISPNTVKSFLKLVMTKVGASNRTAIIAKIFARAS